MHFKKLVNSIKRNHSSIFLFIIIISFFNAVWQCHFRYLLQPSYQGGQQHSLALPCSKENWALDGFQVQHFAPQTTTLYFVWRSHSTYNVKPIYTSKKCGRSLYLYGNYGKEMHCEFATFTLRNCLFLYSYSDKAGIIVVTITLIMWIFLPVFSHNLQRNISQPAICGTDARQHVSSTMQGNMQLLNIPI